MRNWYMAVILVWDSGSILRKVIPLCMWLWKCSKIWLWLNRKRMCSPLHPYLHYKFEQKFSSYAFFSSIVRVMVFVRPNQAIWALHLKAPKFVFTLWMDSKFRESWANNLLLPSLTWLLCDFLWRNFTYKGISINFNQRGFGSVV
jgi:hypothetical protein